MSVYPSYLELCSSGISMSKILKFYVHVFMWLARRSQVSYPVWEQVLFQNPVIFTLNVSKIST